MFTEGMRAWADVEVRVVGSTGRTMERKEEQTEGREGWLLHICARTEYHIQYSPLATLDLPRVLRGKVDGFVQPDGGYRVETGYRLLESALSILGQTRPTKV
jgi:hypothetical protein